METNVHLYENWQDIEDLSGVAALIAAAEYTVNIESTLKMALDGSGECVLALAQGGGEYIGFAFANRGIGLESGGGYLWVNELFVKEEHRRGGVATALLSSFEAWARERRCTRIILAANPTNRAALGLYEKTGFSCQAVAWLEKDL